MESSADTHCNALCQRAESTFLVSFFESREPMAGIRQSGVRPDLPPSG
jgi:hypothetical protein